MERDFPVPIGRLASKRIGAIVTFRTDDGTEYRGRILAVEHDTGIVRAFGKIDFPSESALHLTLIQAIPTRERMLFVIQKGTELGVHRFIPCTSQKSVTSMAPAKGQDKSHRWQVIVERAVEQCRRRVVPAIAPIGAFPEVVRSFAEDGAIKLILYENETTTRMRDLLGAENRPEAVVLVCGPEGGFAEEEVLLAREYGFVPLRLGGRVLRCETAAIAAISIVQHVWGDL
jgi:16S rRNA (uracil1498-N3)-methyltransferase